MGGVRHKNSKSETYIVNGCWLQQEVVAKALSSSSPLDEPEDWVEVASCCAGATDGPCIEGDGSSSIAWGDSSLSDVGHVVSVDSRTVE